MFDLSSIVDNEQTSDALEDVVMGLSSTRAKP